MTFKHILITLVLLLAFLATLAIVWFSDDIAVDIIGGVGSVLSLIGFILSAILSLDRVEKENRR